MGGFLVQIWSYDNDEDIYKLPNISETRFEEIERMLKRKIPISYKKIILEQNGGNIQYNSVKPTQTDNEQILLPINHIYGMGKDGILDSEYLIEEWGLPREILIFSGDGNSFFALDYRTDSISPSVIYLEPESEEKIVVAKTFDDFLNNLSKEEVLIDFEEDEWTGISTEEATQIFAGSDIMLIEETLLDFQYPNNHKWYFEQLLKLSSHENLLIRQTVTNVLANNLELYVMDSEKNSHHLLKEIIDNLISDKNLDIQTEALEIEKKFNH